MDELRACCGSIDITPTRPVPLSGYAHRLNKSDGTHGKLEINVLLLRHKETRLLLITADLFVIGQELRDVVERACNIPARAILFGASHTHFGPATDRLLPRLGRLDDAYLSELKTKLGQLVRDVVAQPSQPVTLYYVPGQANHAVNRRRFALRMKRRPVPHPRFGYQMRPNPGGAKDETIHVIRVVAGDTSQTSCIIWSYACHPVGFPEPNQISADYPGVVRQRIRERLQANVPVLFFQGFGGNVRPPALDRVNGVQTVLRRALYGRTFGPFSWNEWRSWADGLSQRVAECVDQRRGDPLVPALAAEEASVTWNELQDPPLSRPPLHLQWLRLGKRLDLVAMSAEPMIEMIEWVRDEQEGHTVISVGYTDHTFGYLPTRRIWGQGGYEAREFRWGFSLPGEFRPNFEDVVRERLRTIVR